MTVPTLNGSSTAVTMSSSEIADLTGKLHKDVIRDIRVMILALEKDGADLRHVREDKDSRGYTENFHLDRELTETLITGYSIPLRNKVIRRLHEMEKLLQRRLPESLPEALRLAADMAEQKAALELENRQQAETIASLESLFMSGETPTQFCKRLNGVNCSQVNHSLEALGWIYNAAAEESRTPKYRVAARVRDRYLTERPRKIKAEGGDSFIKYDLVLLIDGAKRLHQLYMAKKLAMKAKWDGNFTQAKYSPETNQ